ncbi:hypothetical protein FACS189485_17140 [Spirochaetia bacterium]|nr:hypothetical protein FACS189485_17140 [Spirochaetia bacterium]
MFEQRIENFIGGVLTGDVQKNALEFVAYLRASEMLFERGKGYWEDKLYWLIKYKNEYVCFILINGSEEKIEHDDWIIWSDDSGSNWFEDFPIDEHIKEIVWENIDFCANCGSCGNPGGTRKMIFGKEFNNVCITTMKFKNPDIEALECMKKMVEIRKNDILKTHEGI